MTGGGYGEFPGIRHSMPVKEVGIGCDREVLRRRPLLMGGSSREEKIKRSRKRRRQVGRGDRMSCNH